MRIVPNEGIEALIRLALREDIGDGDVTSLALFSPEDRAEAFIVAKQEGVICGTEVVRYVFEILDPSVGVQLLMVDGSWAKPGDIIIRCEGPVISLLSGERTSLNFFQRMCGIATKTHAVVSLLEGTGIRLLDTRKTVPGFRLLDKYAVAVGGGVNHRMGLFDMVMIKDNHIRAAGGVASAVRRIRDRYGRRYTVEVEASTSKEAEEAADAGADIIMLDNMPIEQIRESVEIVAGRAKIELSGTITEEKIQSLPRSGIDYISMGSLTHSVAAFDCSMELPNLPISDP